VTFEVVGHQPLVVLVSRGNGSQVRAQTRSGSKNPGPENRTLLGLGAFA